MWTMITGKGSATEWIMHVASSSATVAAKGLKSASTSVIILEEIIRIILEISKLCWTEGSGIHSTNRKSSEHRVENPRESQDG